jgi:hypothetical protein
MIHQPELKHLTLCFMLFAFILGSAMAQENENNNTFKVNSNHRGEKGIVLLAKKIIIEPVLVYQYFFNKIKITCFRIFF